MASEDAANLCLKPIYGAVQQNDSALTTLPAQIETNHLRSMEAHLSSETSHLIGVH